MAPDEKAVAVIEEAPFYHLWEAHLVCLGEICTATFKQKQDTEDLYVRRSRIKNKIVGQFGCAKPTWEVIG